MPQGTSPRGRESIEMVEGIDTDYMALEGQNFGKRALCLDDIAYDEARRRFLLKFLVENGWERCFLFLIAVYEYKQLVGQNEKMNMQAKSLASDYLVDLKPPLDEIFSQHQALCRGVIERIDSQFTPLDIFCGLEFVVRTRMCLVYFPAFIQTSHYTDLCTCIRTNHHLPLGEVLANPTYCAYFEAFIKKNLPNQMGSLRFWLDVQTSFLPLVQINQSSNESFEQVQHAVRRIYNRYLAENASIPTGGVVSRDTCADVLMQILARQGESFAPLRYASLFQQAQSEVLSWFEKCAYPRFLKSDPYVFLVVDIGNTTAQASRRRLQLQFLLREQMPSKAVTLIPVDRVPSPSVILSRNDALTSDNSDIICTFEFGVVPTPHAAQGICATVADTKFGYKIIASDAFAAKCPDLPDFCKISDPAARCPALLSPSRRDRQSSAIPASTLHHFVIPSTLMTQNEDSSVKMYYGACYTSWRTMNVATAGEFQALDDIQGDPDSHSGTICVHLPTYKCYVSTQPRIVSLRHKFNHSLAPEATKFQVPVPYPNFCLSNSFPVVDVEVECLFRVLDTENILTVLRGLFLEKRVVMVSKQRSLLTIAGEIWMTLLFPFTWLHSYIPYCPVRHLQQQQQIGCFGVQGQVQFDYKSPSCPKHRIVHHGLCNIQRCTINLLDELGTPLHLKSLSDSIIVDLDRNQVHVPESCDIPCFPNEIEFRMQRSVVTILSPDLVPPIKHGQSIRSEWLTLLHECFNDILGYSWTFFNEPEAKVKECIVFEKEKYLKDHEKDADFYNVFFGTKGFARYLKQCRKTK